MTDNELEQWRAKVEAKRAQNAYFRGVRADDWAAPVLAVPKAKPARPVTPAIDCRVCGTPTRAKNSNPDLYPAGTRPRGRSATCTACVYAAERPASTAPRVPTVLDLPHVIALYGSGMSAREIGAPLGLSKHTILRELHSAGVQTRDPRAAALVRAA